MTSHSEKYVVVRLRDGYKYETRPITCGVVLEYPQDWLQDNQGKKPSVAIPQTKLNKESLSRTVMSHLKSQNISSQLVRAYLYDQLHEISEICPEDWKSCGIMIARKGEKISIFGTLDITKHEYEVDAVEAGNQPNDKALVGNILGICRMKTISSGAAAANTSKALQDRYSRIYGMEPIVSFAEGKFNFSTWANDPDLTKMLAAIDMFFHRFSSHPLAHYRLGTIVQRYRDCAALESIHYVLKRKAMNAPSELFEWMWTEYLFRDVERIYCKDMAEAYSAYSYFPYFVAFGMSKKSPYSVTANPAIHAFCQTVNVASRDVRGINARLVMAAGMNKIIENGLQVAYALRSDKRLQLLYVSDKNLERVKKARAYYSLA